MPTPTPTDSRPELGAPRSAIETPALLIDLDVMSRNVERFVAFADEQNVRLRSHTKTHKTPALAHLQHERSGGGGIVCQTLSEAEVMAHGGIDDIYLSYMVVGERKLARLARLSETVEQFATTVDGPGNIHPLQRRATEHGTSVGVVLEIDVGLSRTGVTPGEPAVELARLIAEQPNLRFDGILAYEAHVKADAETEADYERLCHEAMETAADTVDRIESAGIPVDEVKVGGTATSLYSGRHPVVTEINPGMYPFNDVGEIEHRPWAVDKSDCAATVLTSVISAPADDRVVVDGGSKAFGLDKPHHPVPKNRGDVAYANASEEHGWIDVSGAEKSPTVGDILEFIAPHVCTTINLHETLVGIRDGRVENVWSIQGRGKLK